MTLSPARRTLLFALVLTAGVLNYVDRQIIAVLKPVIALDLGWSDNDYGTLAAWFQGAAAFAFLVTGWLADKLGVKWANPIGVAAWSVAAMAHGWATSFSSFVLCRVGLGATEAMGTPNQIKSVAAIFPPHLRSTGIGAGNAVGSLGAIAAPLLIPAFAMAWGWRAAFVSAGLFGIGWSLVWLVAVRGMTFTGPAQAAAAADEQDLAYGPILGERRTWAFVVAKVLSDATWWLMLFWMPDFFHRTFGLSGTALGPPLAIAYTGSAIGSLASGSIASALYARGWSVNRVRKSVMLVSALMVLPVWLALHTADYWTVVLIMAVALAGHQGFSTTLFALIIDLTPQAKVGRVTATAAFFGNLGGMAISKIAGLVLTWGLGYGPLFAFASVSYLLAVGWIQLLLPVIRAGPRRPTVAMAMH